MNNVGLGQLVPNDGIRVFIANRPPLDIYQQRNNLQPMELGEINEIARLTGNHWRKIFNVYAKIMFALLSPSNSLSSNISTWQLYRDNTLLQHNSATALLFSKPSVQLEASLNPKKSKIVNLVMGKQHAASLGLDREHNTELVIIDNDFAISKLNNIIVCPYFDYRQLSNIKIDHLIKLINKMQEK